MSIEWHKVTRYSKLAALIVFIALPFFGFYLGIQYEAARKEISRLDTLLLATKTAVPNTTQPSNYELYQQRQGKIELLKANPQLPVDNIYDLQAILAFSEKKQLFETARSFVSSHSTQGMQFDLVFNWKKGSWIRFAIIPENIETDNAQLFMEKVDGKWVVRGFGTAFPDLYEQHPELFR